MGIAGLLKTSKYSKGIMRAGNIGQNAPHVILTSGGNNIILPLPDDITSSLSVGWEPTELGIFKDVAHNKQDYETVKGTVGALGKNAVWAVKKAGWTLVSGGKGQAIAEKRAGAILNANKEMLFNGADFRRFTFNWTILPTSSQDAKQLHDIIRAFQRASLGSLADSKRLIKYPDSWKIKFQKAKLVDIADCVITNTNVAYSTGGKLIMHNDQHPVSTTLSVMFNEVAVLTSEDVPKYGG